MLTAEEKLMHFSQTVFAQANAQAEKINAETEKEVKDKLNRIENDCLSEAYKYIQKEVNKIQKQYGEAVSKLELDCKKELLKARDNMVNDIFQSVMKKLGEFTKTDAYKDYLLNCAERAMKELACEKVIITLNYTDSELKDFMSEKLPQATVVISDEENNFYGGLNVLSHETSQICDFTFSALLYEEKKKFISGGNLVL